uniref:C2H2-type domain-containing protein n=1 Tax=Oryza punctata TaxID=4537 RepID=A0A0E0MIC5_ORYPU
MEVATNTNNTTRSPVKLMLVLTLSPASKVITKGGGGKRVHLDGGAFQCRTCGRRFSTFQALGGHRTSHKRPRVRADGLDLLLGARPGKVAGGGSGASTPVVHRCDMCGKVFATGQALGGHMRRHRPLVGSGTVSTTWTTATAATMSGSSSEERDDDDDCKCNLCVCFVVVAAAMDQEDYTSLQLELEEEEDDDQLSQLAELDVQLSLACGSTAMSSSGDEDDAAPRLRKRRRRREATAAAYECRTCGRRFASHQALGGHRTSHLRPTTNKRRPGPSRPVIHACEVCGLGFQMGQALGGHMRRHRPRNIDLGLKQIILQEIRPSSSLKLLDLFV